MRTFTQIFVGSAWLMVTAAAMAAPPTLGNERYCDSFSVAVTDRDYQSSDVGAES
jgi:hypothetical protein